MSLARFTRAGLWVLAVLLVVQVAGAADLAATLRSGRPDLKSAGVMAFGPDGILFVGDSVGGAVFAFDTQDRAPGAAGAQFEVQGINEKVAAMLGTAADQILINDAVVNPVSKKVYLSVSRGRGPSATPVILRVTSAGKIEEFSLDNVKFSRVDLPNAPDADKKDGRGQSPRMEAITGMAYVDGKVVIAGLSNEEFASKLRVVPFPFASADKGASVEIWHGSHGRFETNAPVRTFLPYKINGEQNILAAYTCTPLVKFPISQLKPGSKVMGTTIAELGNRNRPLDMIVYQRGGRDYILMNNSSRGVMKMSTENIQSYQPITKQTEITGLPYQTIESLKGVEQLDKLDDSKAVILVRNGGSLDLKTIALP